MKRISFKQKYANLLNTIAAAAVTFVALPAAFASPETSGLETFLAEPTSFVAISEGAPGHVTFAAMAGDRLAVQYMIPTHSGEMFGEIVGTVDDRGVFFGNSMLIDENGGGESTPVTLIFNNDGSMIAQDTTDVATLGFFNEVTLDH